MPGFISKYKKYKFLSLALIVILLQLKVRGTKIKKSQFRNYKHRTTIAFSTFPLPKTKRICMAIDDTLRARHKSCFLRPDTGPCRADLIQWYFDVKQRRCYRFFWGGCQGNGNRFRSNSECMNFCHLNTTDAVQQLPYFCNLAFDYGNCFGHYNRFTWDKFSKSCRRRIYSGCGGNQNNFESQQECLETCLKPPNNTLQRFRQFTTCIPFHIGELF